VWSYRFQRWWLKRNFARCKVTINGSVRHQPKHCFSFENPCLTDKDVAVGKKIQNSKTFTAPFNLVFAGRLEDAKGILRIIEALASVNLNLVGRIDFIGDGPKRKEYENLCSFLGKKARFHGFLGSTEVHKLLSEGHFLLLPSDSEGFPKVIAEAACYGCLPVVSDVGSIGDYVKNETNGFIWKKDGPIRFSTVLESALTLHPKELQKKSNDLLQLAEMFTFENYLCKLETFILN
jgi:glycosyltransferase involved in cell wall biosynthesis